MRISVLRRKLIPASVLGLTTLLGSLAGCQSWWNKSSSQSLLGFANENKKQEADDWEHPNSQGNQTAIAAPAYRPPSAATRNSIKPEKNSRVTLPRDRQKETASTITPNSDLANLPAPRTSALAVPNQDAPKTMVSSASKPSHEETPPTQPSEPTPTPVVQTAANLSKDAAASEILDSGVSDVDVQGALASLPADFQAKLRQGPPGSLSRDGSSSKNIDELDPKDPTRWTGHLNQSVVALEKYIESSSDMDPAIRMHHELTLRLLYLAQRNLEQAKLPIPGADPREQAYLEHQVTALNYAISPDPNPSRPRHWAQVAAEQRHADRQLAALSSLQVSPPVFCTQVDGYGVTHKFEKNAFAPDQQVLLYCELENVSSQKVREGYETRVKGSYEIRDAQGKRVVEQALPMEPDVCSCT
jgi:hypothetical protein